MQHIMRRGLSDGRLLPQPFERVLLLLPTWQALVEDLDVTIASAVQLLIGQTGQMVWAASIEDDRNVARDLRHTGWQDFQRDGHGLGQMSRGVLCRTADIHQHRRKAGIELPLYGLDVGKRNGDRRILLLLCKLGIVLWVSKGWYNVSQRQDQKTDHSTLYKRHYWMHTALLLAVSEQQ